MNDAKHNVSRLYWTISKPLESPHSNRKLLMPRAEDLSDLQQLCKRLTEQLFEEEIWAFLEMKVKFGLAKDQDVILSFIEEDEEGKRILHQELCRRPLALQHRLARFIFAPLMLGPETFEAMYDVYTAIYEAGLHRIGFSTKLNVEPNNDMPDKA